MRFQFSSSRWSRSFTAVSGRSDTKCTRFTEPCLFLRHLALAFRWFWIRRRQFQTVLASSASPYNQSRYVRMLALTAVDMLVFFPACFGGLLRHLKASHLQSYPSWASVHSAFNRHYAISAEDMSQSPDTLASLLLSRWLCPVSAFIFFAMFGLSQEARQAYMQVFGIRKLVRSSRHHLHPASQE